MEGVIIFIAFIFGLAILGIQIWGIVAAVKTKDTEIRAGKLLLHLFLWGGFTAAIVYAIQAKN